MAEEPDGTLITLLDEDGNEQEFEHLATLDYEGSTYVALAPAFSEPEELVESDGELVVLKVTQEDESGEEMLESIADENEFQTVLRKFEKMLEADYDILDEDGEPFEDENGDDGEADGDDFPDEEE